MKDWTEGIIGSFGSSDEIPKGWHSPATFAKIKNCSDVHAGKLLMLAWRAGKCQRRKFRTEQPTGRLYPTMYYGPK